MTRTSFRNFPNGVVFDKDLNPSGLKKPQLNKIVAAAAKTKKNSIKKKDREAGELEPMDKLLEESELNLGRESNFKVLVEEAKNEITF